jgi:hypothetical protein
MAAAGKGIVTEVENALSQGKKVIIYPDGKPVQIASINNGMMADAEGHRWGTMPLVAQLDNAKPSIRIEGPAGGGEGAVASVRAAVDRGHEPTFTKPQLDPSSPRYAGPEDPEVAVAGQNVGKPSSFETMAQDYGVDMNADAASAEVKQIEAENRLSDADRLALKEADEAIAKADAWAEALKAAATCVLKV